MAQARKPRPSNRRKADASRPAKTDAPRPAKTAASRSAKTDASRRGGSSSSSSKSTRSRTSASAAPSQGRSRSTRATKTASAKGPAKGQKRKTGGGRTSSASSPSRSSELGRVMLSGGAAAGHASGYHHSITIDDKSRQLKATKSGGSRAKAQRPRRSHRGVIIAVVVIVIVAVGLLIDGMLTQDRIYAGVRVGTLDVSGKTEAEAAALITETFGPSVADARCVVFADEEVANDYETKGVLSVRDRDDQWESIVKDAGEGLLWIADTQTLRLSLPAEALAAEALAIGRETGGFFTRVGALFSGYQLIPRVDIGRSAFDELVNAINLSTGQPRREYGVEVVEGQASVVAGEDGYSVDRTLLEQLINRAIFDSQSAGVGITVAPEYGPIMTTEPQAALLAQKINDALGHKLVFTCLGTSIEPTRDEVGSWVRVVLPAQNPNQAEPDSTLTATLDEEALDAYLASEVHPLIRKQYTLTFEDGPTEPVAELSSGAPLPTIKTAVATVNDGLFKLSAPAEVEGNETSETTTYPDTVEVPIEVAEAPARLSLTDARAAGLVAEISTYETTYLADNTNRVINIHLAADYLNNSIVNPDETWSFLNTVGDPSEERGFVGAGAIIANEHQDAVGGGVCQVATTVFNAVYESGFPITRRYNHSLYMANYPDGRDAAVSYPDLDLMWKNDSDSGVVVASSYTDSSLTITLYGVDPGYKVSSSVGEWQEGKPYSKTTKVDSTLGAGQSYIETYGEDGRIISVTRKVDDEDGERLREDLFYSEYQPLNEVTVVGG